MMETKLMRILATVLTLWALLLWPAVALARQPGEPIPTGDPLYDRLQQAVLDEHRDDLDPGNPFLTGSQIWQWAPALETIEAWDDEFGQRSDYWELRAVVAAAANGSKLPDRPSLRRAMECADAGQAAARELMSRALRNIRADGTLSASEEDARTAELISEYIARFPGSRWVYSEAADHLARLGIDARWMEVMRKCNSLPDAQPADLYPLSFVRQRMLAGQPVGDQAVAGSILATGSMLSEGGIHEYIVFKDCYKELIVGADVDLMATMTILSERELSQRVSAGSPWLCCTPQIVNIMSRVVLADLSVWQADTRPQGYSRYLADFDQFDGYCEGIHARLAADDPKLAQYLAGNPSWAVLHDTALYPWIPEDPYPEVGLAEGIGFLLGQLNDLSMYHRYEQEYALTRWLLDNEVPRCREMLEHLATFDFEHPELYVGMEQSE